MEKIKVVMSGLPGNMASEVAEAVQLSDDIGLCTEALGLSDANFELLFPEIYNRDREITINILGLKKHEEYLNKNRGKKLMVADFTQPDAVNRNAEMYCRFGNPFVMGTTGGDRKKLEETVKNSETCEVIAPNMAKQVVALQWAMEGFAGKNPGALKGYTLKIIESHQQGKKDTSGTAKAMVKYFNQLGIEFDVSQIEKIRDPAKQREMGVPEQYLKGHGWHTYLVTPPKKEMTHALALIGPQINSIIEPQLTGFFESNADIFVDGKRYVGRVFEPSDRTMLFEFGANPEDNGIVITHNINGRRPYALGTLDAIRYLHGKVEKGEKGLFSMVDVVQGR